jgi:hypothetical protein
VCSPFVPSRAARELALSQPSVSNQVASLEREIDATKVTVDEGTDDLPARVRSGELHLAVAIQDTAEPRHEPPGVERRDLFQEHFRVALAPDHPLAERPEVRLADLRDDDWTAATTDGLIVRACRAAGFEPNLVSITRDQLAIRALIRRGLAVTLTPNCSPNRSRTSPSDPSPAPAPHATSTPCCHPAAATCSSHPRSTRSPPPPQSCRRIPGGSAGDRRLGGHCSTIRRSRARRRPRRGRSRRSASSRAHRRRGCRCCRGSRSAAAPPG